MDGRSGPYRAQDGPSVRRPRRDGGDLRSHRSAAATDGTADGSAQTLLQSRPDRTERKNLGRTTKARASRRRYPPVSARGRKSRRRHDARRSFAASCPTKLPRPAHPRRYRASDPSATAAPYPASPTASSPCSLPCSVTKPSMTKPGLTPPTPSPHDTKYSLDKRWAVRSHRGRRLAPREASQSEAERASAPSVGSCLASPFCRASRRLPSARAGGRAAGLRRSPPERAA